MQAVSGARNREGEAAETREGDNKECTDYQLHQMREIARARRREREDERGAREARDRRSSQEGRGSGNLHALRCTSSFYCTFMT